MITGTTRTGFAYQVQEDSLDDYELVEALNRFESGEPQLITTIIDKMLGNEQREALKNHVRENGKVSLAKMMDELSDIFNQKNEIKN